jgi:hypothetical protein
MKLRLSLVLALLFFSGAVNAQTDSATTIITPPVDSAKAPAAPGKMPSFRSINLTYIHNITPKGNGINADFEIPGDASKRRMKFGFEYRNNTLNSTTVFFDHIWHWHGAHLNKFFNSFYEAGAGFGFSGVEAYLPTLELRAAWGLRMSLSQRINMKTAIKTRIGVPNVFHFDIEVNEPYAEASVDVGFGYDLF